MMTEEIPPEEEREVEDTLTVLERAGLMLSPRQEAYIGSAWIELFDLDLVVPENIENWYIAACLTTTLPRERLPNDVDPDLSAEEYATSVLLAMAREIIVLDDYMEHTSHDELYRATETFSYDLDFKNNPTERAHLLRTTRLYIFMSGR